MKNILREVFQAINYMKKEICFAFIMYTLGALLGVLIFKDKTLEMDPQNLGVGVVLLNNIKIALILFGLGIVTLGIGSSIYIFINGAILGGASMGVYNMYSMEPIITGILPHVFFEVMGLCMFTAVSYETLKLLLNVVTKRKMKKVFIKKDLIILGLGVVLLSIAAIIEGLVSRA